MMIIREDNNEDEKSMVGRLQESQLLDMFTIKIPCPYVKQLGAQLVP